MHYKSTVTLLGLPLLHIAVGGGPGTSPRGIARGWVAVGDISFGIVLSVGGVALGAGLTLGGVGVGLICVSGLSIGLLLALGGLAIGYVACGGAAIALKAAFGGLAIARDYALGGAAFARHANDAAARKMFDEQWLLAFAQFVLQHSQWLIVLAVVPALLALYRHIKSRSQGSAR